MYWNGERVSSTAIRQALKARRPCDGARPCWAATTRSRAASCAASASARKLGFPTANVNLKRLQAPIDGIFAARVTGLGGAPLDGVASVGTRPTIGGGTALLEVLIFDFDREIYGEYITVQFVKRLREEHHFERSRGLAAPNAC